VDGAEELLGDCPVDRPLLSIAIPTFRRPEFLLEAVVSALGQKFDYPFEVIVVDNDPASNGHRLLLDAVPNLLSAPFRYLRNRRNIGEFPNFNRCVEEARGEWVTILHDDDLLHPSWAREMFAVLGTRPSIDGLICDRANLDQRATPVGEGRLKSIARRAVRFLRFGFGQTRRIDARKLFWECPGNTVGFVCRKRDLQAVGGFRADEHPSADHFFYLRFGKRFRLLQFKKTLVSIRIADNSLLAPETHFALARRNHEIRSACIAAGVPRWWARLLPLLTARQVVAMSGFYRVPVTPAQVGRMLGIRVVRDRPLLLWTLRALCRGF
jgi:glycosyltransferase involved in cell wall biosynthesis